MCARQSSRARGLHLESTPVFFFCFCWVFFFFFFIFFFFNDAATTEIYTLSLHDALPIWASLSEAHRRYTRHINFKKGWRGHLWQERFHSFPMDEHYLLATVRYVELNPVKAELCTHPQDWKWSSASAHMAGSDDILVTVKPMLDRVGNWQHYLSIDDSSNNDLVAQHTRTGRPLGSDHFVNKLEDIYGKPLAPKKPGRKPYKDY